MHGAHATMMALERIHRARGTALTLHRSGVSPDVSIFAKVFGADGQELTGSMDDIARRVRITNYAIAAAAWPGPPRRGDTIGSYVIEVVDTRSVGDVAVSHIMEVSSAG